ncbi:hypothetical protein HK096_001640, partial [Nowakowskiella sp. JEL0078]
MCSSHFCPPNIKEHEDEADKLEQLNVSDEKSKVTVKELLDLNCCIETNATGSKNIKELVYK